MNITVEYIPTSSLYHDRELDWSERRIDELAKSSIHFGLRCRHDRISYSLDTNDMYCPDCENKDLMTIERLEYLRAYKLNGIQQ